MEFNMNKFKKELLVPVLVIVVLLGYLFMEKSDKMQYDIPEFKQLQTASLDKIEIKKAKETITLVKKDDKWLVDPKGYPTDDDKIKKITDTITSLQLTDLVSKKENYSRYHLHKEKAIAVKAYQKGDVVRDFEIGKAAATYGHTFVKVKDNPNVYHARESFRNNFDTKVDDLRDKKVMKVEKNEITELTIESEGKKTHLTRKVTSSEKPAPLKPDPKAPIPTAAPQQQDQIYWVTAEGTKGKTPGIDTLLGQFAKLDCEKYIENKTKEDYKKEIPYYSIKLKGAKDYTVTIYKKLEEGDDKGKYPVVSSENPYPFLLNSYRGDQLIKKPEDLLDIPKKEEKKETKPKK